GHIEVKPLLPLRFYLRCDRGGIFGMHDCRESDMRVHISETGYQKLSATIDPTGLRRHGYRFSSAERDDLPIAAANRLIRQDLFTVHGNHRHVHKGGNASLGVTPGWNNTEAQANPYEPAQ